MAAKSSFVGGLFLALLAVGCGGRIAVDPDADAHASNADASVDAMDTSDAIADDARNGGRGPAPVPTCNGKTECVPNDAGTYSGAATIQCDPVHFQGPWTLLLERMINGQFQTVQTQIVSTPGFGAMFQDTTVRAARLTYHVCAVDDQGTRCSESFTTDPPPSCACEPYTCDYVLACSTGLDDGCGHVLRCGACIDGTTCNLTTHSCCPPGEESNGHQGCQCAPPGPCPRHQFWDFTKCYCDVFQP